MKNFCFIADENDETTRLDSYLSAIFSDFSRAKIQNFIKDKQILVNEEFKKAAYKIKMGDKITVKIPDEERAIYPPQDIKLEIVWEDENMAVINKPSGMLTHPTTIEKENTLVNALLFKYGENLSDINGELRRGILHRLDRNTSGLLMIAKNNKTHEFLAEQIKERLIVKKYLAVVKGAINNDTGTINLPIGRHPTKPHKMAVVKEENGGKASLTEYKVLKRYRENTYLELDLKTGRTHQIRVHLSHLKHPIVNDTLYGGGNFKVKTQEQVLQSYKLEFTKPFTHDKIKLEIKPDEKIEKCLKMLESGVKK